MSAIKVYVCSGMNRSLWAYSAYSTLAYTFETKSSGGTKVPPFCSLDNRSASAFCSFNSSYK